MIKQLTQAKAAYALESSPHYNALYDDDLQQDQTTLTIPRARQGPLLSGPGSEEHGDLSQMMVEIKLGEGVVSLGDGG